MHRWNLLLLTGAIFTMLIIGCSGDSAGISPLAPSPDVEMTQENPVEPEHSVSSQAQLWGYYDLYFDTESESVEIVVNRTAMFTVNIVKFLNNDPLGLAVSFNGTSAGPGFIDIDLDVTITHPLNIAKFDGYDVRGIFIGNGSGIMAYSADLVYPVHGTDQILLNADGYSRWYNPAEFLSETIFGYVPGNLASSGYSGTATLNGYKYFGEGLAAADDFLPYLTSGGAEVGYFLHGTSNTRNYQIRFPIPAPGVKYGYAVVANWEGGLPGDHPSHAEEAVAVNLTDDSTLFYVDGTSNGGDLILDISVCDWHSELTGGVMQDYAIIVESTVLSTPYTLNTTEMTPAASGANWHKYHVEIPADMSRVLTATRCG